MNTRRPGHNGLYRPLPSVDAGHETVTPIAPETIVVTPPPPAAPVSRVYTQAELDAERERVRQEEKTKLYADRQAEKDRLAAFEAQVNELTSTRQAEIAAAEQKAREEAQAEAEARWAEMDSSAKVEEVRNEFENRFKTLQAQQDAERAMFDKEREFAALGEYTRTVVQNALTNNELAPELADLVSGNNQAEIDASLEQMKAKSSQIAESIAGITQQARSQQRGVSPTGYTATGPMEINPGQRTLTPEDIAAMPMSEYAKLRPQLVRGSSTENRGMFG